MTYMRKLIISLLLLSSGIVSAEGIVISFLGSPGAGKSSQATVLAEKLGIPHLSAGALLREQVEANTEIGQACQSFMDRGEYVPDALILEVLTKRLDAGDCSEGYIFDGFPRTTSLWFAFKEMQTEEDTVLLVYLEVDSEVAVERCSQRWNDGGRVVDADPELIRRRIEMEARCLEPVLECVESEATFFHIDANTSFEDCQDMIWECVKNYAEGERDK